MSLKDKGNIITGMKNKVAMPEGVSFDGVADYMSRSTDLVGNVDSKTFTFSCWVYTEILAQNEIYTTAYDGSASGIGIRILSSAINITAWNAAGTAIIDITVSLIQKNTNVNIICSIDLVNSIVSFSLNDKIYTSTITTLVNDTINFTYGGQAIGQRYAGISDSKRLSHLFLDYTYRDLSIEANRRLFITADGKPAGGLDSVDKYLGDIFNDGSITLPLGVVFKDNGNKLYLSDYGTGTVVYYTVTTPYDISTASRVSSFTPTNNTLVYGIDFNDTGTILIVDTQYSQSIDSYNLATPWDITSAVFSSSFGLAGTSGTASRSVSFNDTGTKMYDFNGTLFEYSLSTPYDLTTAVAQLSTVLAGSYHHKFSYDGLNIMTLDSGSLKIYQYPLGIAWDISSIDIAQESSLYIGDVSAVPYAIEYNPDGSLIYITGLSLMVAKYTLSTPYDLSTATCGKLANTPAQPILYLPMKDAATAHINLGTGGDFIQNGLIETADRGANQDNCVASTFDGVDDTLDLPIVFVDTKVSTISVTVNITVASSARIFSLTDATDTDITLYVFTSGSNIYVYSIDRALGKYAFQGYVPYTIGRTITVTATIDLNGNSYIYGNNIAGVVSLNDATALLTYSYNPLAKVGATGVGTDFVGGSIGELYFDTTYTDLATNNPFWNSDTNKPISVRKAIADNGLNPLIAMPLDASNITKNYGTGGDFTWNDANASGTKGARGASEYISRSAKALNNGDRLTFGTGFPLDSKTISVVFTSKCNADGLAVINGIQGAVNQTNEAYGGSFIRTFQSDAVSRATLSVNLLNSLEQQIFYFDNVWIIPNTEWVIVQVSIDLLTGVSSASINGTVIAPSPTVNTNDTFTFSNLFLDIIGTGDTTPTTDSDGTMSMCYVTTDYIDFSQESNRNLFVNQLGYPRDLQPLIADGTIPNPLIYLPFDDTANLGKNLGTGGDFTVNGTVTAGADFAI